MSSLNAPCPVTRRRSSRRGTGAPMPKLFSLALAFTRADPDEIRTLSDKGRLAIRDAWRLGLGTILDTRGKTTIFAKMANDGKTPVPLILTALAGIPTVAPGQDLAAIVLDAMRASNLELRDNDILVLAQKIVSKAEGRFVRLAEVAPSPEALTLAAETGKDARVVELILRESSEIVRKRPGVIIAAHRLGHVMANAGIDASNVEPAGGEETVLLLPADPDASAARLRAALRI